jgi:hypothetical protein
VPVRDGPVVASTVRLTEPDPLPLAPVASAIHGALLVAVQPQPDAAPTLTSSGPPPAPIVRLSGDTSKLQPGDCVTVKTCPATVTVPVRDGPEVGFTVKVTPPLPDPLVVPSVIQSALLAAVHGQPAPAVTAIVPAPPAAPVAKLAGAIANAQPSDWVTLKESPAIFRVPVRGGPDVGATVNATGADPRPLAPEVMVIQSASEVAVQLHNPLDARTPTLPVPPAVANEAELSASENVHSAAACVICARFVLTVMPPLRTTGSGLAEAANWTVPSPWPELPDGIVSQAASDWADHWHSRSVEMGIEPVPPEADKVEDGASNATAHFDTEDGEMTVLPELPQPAASTPHIDTPAITAAANTRAGATLSYIVHEPLGSRRLTQSNELPSDTAQVHA